MLTDIPEVDHVLTDPPYDDFTHQGAFTMPERFIQAEKKNMGINLKHWTILKVQYFF